MTWHDDAACHPDHRPEHVTPAEWNAIWYPMPQAKQGRPARNEQMRPDMYDAARTYCERCPVKDECLHDAMREEAGLDAKRRHGMRGGMSPTGRHRMPWRVCQWCGAGFAAKPGSRARCCSEACREAQRTASIIEYQRRRAAESRPEWCDMCDFEAANLSGMQLHMRMAHGVAA